MKKPRLIFAILCVGLLLTGCGKIPTLKSGEQVVASIDGKDFTAESLYTKLKEEGGYQILVNMIDEFIANKEIPDDTEAKENAATQVETFKAQVEGYGQDFLTTIKSYGFQTEDELTDYYILNFKLNKVMKNYLKKDISDKQIDDYYKDNIYGEMTVRHILIDPETNDDMTEAEVTAAETAAYKKAEELIAKLKNGEDFAKLAKENSDDKGTASEGGLYSNFVKGDGTVDEFWDASVKLKDNEFTDKPVKTQFGYHIILRVKQNAKPKLADVKNEVIDSIIEKMIKDDTDLQTKTWAKIRKEYNLNIVDTELKKSYDDLVK